MSSDWPRRPFHELPPPEGGAFAVRRAARRRRARAATVASAGVALVLVGVAVLAQPGGAGPKVVLRVTDVPSGTVTPTATATASGAAPSASPSARARSSQLATPSVTPGARRTPDPGREGSGAVAYRTPDLTRTYLDRSSATGLTVCSGSESGSGTVVRSTVDWCLDAAVTRTSRGHDLVAQVCRDASSDAQLSFDSRREVELTVQDAAGRTVWLWSAGHPDAPDPHVLQVGREHCWVWTAAWTDVDAHGQPLPSGSYVLVAGPRARELRTAPTPTATFTV